ncbi:MAG: winged helix-turn-helix domain-containing protein [Candidatus Bathyarchaeota archaeon]|nr:winged helix-turn-helix domain-containing protein [Candidatus Bathyarchaeota archaeon]
MGEQRDILRGLTLKVYRFILKNNKPVGIREVQRALKLSSPTLALYHINKLEEAGLVKKHLNGYVADRIFFGELRQIETSPHTSILLLHSFLYSCSNNINDFL